MEEIASSQITQKASRGCCSCGISIPLDADSPRWRDLDIHCDTCQKAADKKAEELFQEKHQMARDFLLSTIPSAFRNTIRARLPHPEKLDAALQWKFGPVGLLLYGPTGCGKSRVAWEVAKREVLASRKVKCVSSFELSRYPSLFMADSGAATAFADELAGVELLILDDVFKAKQTERVEELLFAVLDERGQWERPCIVTLNDTGETLTARLSSDRGPALIRRLREYCQSIQF
jgi:DNA replication protein DnaC